jgi:hypothetical protein
MEAAVGLVAVALILELQPDAVVGAVGVLLGSWGGQVSLFAQKILFPSLLARLELVETVEQPALEVVEV